MSSVWTNVLGATRPLSYSYFVVDIQNLDMQQKYIVQFILRHPDIYRRDVLTVHLPFADVPVNGCR